jgi:hypothetical protein
VLEAGPSLVLDGATYYSGLITVYMSGLVLLTQKIEQLHQISGLGMWKLYILSETRVMDVMFAMGIVVTM